MTLEERFWKFVEKTETCWNWTGCLSAAGYSQFRIAGQTVYGHRFVYELMNGEIAEGMFVCHKCDNRKCVNPNHLFVGTQGDNNQDMFRKGRNIYGERCKWSKLSQDQVNAIRSSPKLQKDIAQEFGVSTCLISLIRSGKRWKNEASQTRS